MKHERTNGKNRGNLAVVVLLAGTLACLPVSRGDINEVEVSVAPSSPEFFLGEQITVTVSIANNSDSVARVLKTPKAFWAFAIDLTVTNAYGERVQPTKKHPAPTEPHDVDYRGIPPKQSLVVNVNLATELGLAARDVGTYSIWASVLLNDTKIESLPVPVVVKALPSLANRKTTRISLRSQSGRYDRVVDVGVVRVGPRRGILLAVLRDEGDPIPRVFRLGRVPIPAQFDARVDTGADVHILATDPKGDQNYFVLRTNEERATKAGVFRDGRRRALKPSAAGDVQIEIVE